MNAPESSCYSESEMLKHVPAIKVERCPVASLINIYELQKTALLRKVKPCFIKTRGPKLREFNNKMESTLVESEKGEPCMGILCDFYAGRGKDFFWCKYEMWNSMTEEGKKRLKKK